MTRPLLALLLALLVACLAALFLLGGERGTRRGERPLPPPPAPEPGEPAPTLAELLPPPVVRTSSGPVTTTVLWPVKVELELLGARFLPKQEGVPPVGSGAGARLSGRITGFDDRGVPAEIRFRAGANAGRVLRADEEGRFGAVDLYPGLSVVEVRGAGTLGSRRELRLRKNQETLLNIGYGRPGTVVGKVQDSTGQGLEGAAVVIDGTRVVTDAKGEFFVQSVAAGQVLCEVEKEGYALYQELVWVAGGATTPSDRTTFTLKEAAELRIALSGSAGGPGPAQIFLYAERPEFDASSAFRNESFPWHALNPTEAWPGRPVTIGKLRAGVVKVHVFRPGARAVSKTVNLAAGVRDLVIPLEPAPVLSGVVREDGAPVLGATVTLEAPDRARATIDYFREPSYFLETAVMPNLPPAFQETRTDAQGRFVLSAWSDVAPVRYLEARGPGGGTWAGRYVGANELEVKLDLEEVQLGDSTLLVDFPGRHQGLPVELWIGGAPVSSAVLAPGEDLEVASLVAGAWRANATWHGQPLLANEELVVEDVERLTIPVPPECIEGQSEEQWKRAGREFPHGS